MRNPWKVRASVAGLLAVLCLLAGFSILTQDRIAARSERADQASQLSDVYQDARFQVGQEESLERKYRLEPGPAVRALHDAAERDFARDLQRLVRVDGSPATRATVARLLRLHAGYIQATDTMFRAVDAHDTARVLYVDHALADPVFGAIEQTVFGQAGSASRRSLADSDGLRDDETAATRAIASAFALALALLVGLGLVIVRISRGLDAARVAEVERLAEIAFTDPLTGLRNHRAFHEALGRRLHRAGGLSLIMLDLDRLKQVNDTLGHQAGDKRLRALADAIGAGGFGDGYRVGGDEFALILDDVRAWHALELVQRLRTTLQDVGVVVSAGIAEMPAFTDKDRLIHEADLALISTKRRGQAVGIYSPDMEPDAAGAATVEDEQHTRTLAGALAMAVDAKDSYTRSHCQTVSELCVLIAAALGFDGERLARIRVAGLLHDVGKIGVPDAILNKPAKLTDDEYEQIKAHSVLGHDIVFAAGLAAEARWVRHHHERYDGRGYPDALGGDAIPLESRIIGVADAYEAMTSDRPYRRAPGQEHAIGELRRHSGTQFDPIVAAALCRALEQGEERAEAGRELLVGAGVS
jgi:diguanylate cyclase (GGDEF)-like protein